MASVLARVGVALGAVLLVIGAFVPWLRLTSSTLGVYDQGFSPWSALRSALTSSTHNTPSISGIIFVSFLPGVMYDSFCLVRQNSRRARMRFAIALVVLGFGIVALIVFTLIFLPLGLSLGYPYYDVEMDVGGLIAGIGAILVISSALLSI